MARCAAPLTHSCAASPSLLLCNHDAPVRAPPSVLQLYNGSTNPYFLAARRIYEAFWSVMRSSILPSLEAAGIVEPKL